MEGPFLRPARSPTLGLALAVGLWVPGLRAQVVELVDPPARLGETGAARMLADALPGVRVTPTGTGELVLSGSRELVDAAVALLARLDRPAREVMVELVRGAASLDQGGESTFVVNAGRSRVPSTFTRTSGRARSSGQQGIRLQEGGTGTLFVGGEVPYSSGGLLNETRYLSAGQGLRLRLLRVDPGRGALLELEGENDGFGAPGPAGPTIARERVGTTVYAPFGVPTLVATHGSDVASGQATGFARGGLTVTEERVGPGGTRTVTRTPLDGAVGVGRSRIRQAGGLTYTVVVRELPAHRD